MDDEAELPDADFLRDLAGRLRHVPIMYGVDGYHIDRLFSIAAAMPTQEIDLFGDV